MLIIHLIEFITSVYSTVRSESGTVAVYCICFTQPQRGGTAIACPVIEPPSHGATAPGGPITGPALYGNPTFRPVRFRPPTFRPVFFNGLKRPTFRPVKLMTLCVQASKKMNRVIIFVKIYMQKKT